MNESVYQRKYQDEHILVCLSSSPSNAKVILYAAQMKTSLDARLTALYVQSPSPYYGTSSQDEERLKQNTELARANGADVKYIKGDDIAFQISQFAEANGITRIVIGRSMHRSGKWLKRSLLDQILKYVSDIAIDIIPDKDMKTYSLNRLGGLFGFSWMDLLKSVAVFAAVTLIGEVFGTGIIGGLLAYPIAVAFMSVVAGSVAFYAYIVPFLISTVVGSLIAGTLLLSLQRTGVLPKLLT